MAQVSKNDEFCIKNEELCIKNEEFCIKMMDFVASNCPFAPGDGSGGQFRLIDGLNDD